MKCCLFTLAVLLTTMLLAAEEDKAERPDKQLIQGTWKVVALEADGKKAPENAFKQKRFLIEGDKIATTGKPEDLAPYRLDATAKPRALDLPGSVEGQFAKAIYEVKGDTFKLCFSQSTKLDRPKVFDTAGTRYFCFTLQRVADVEGSWERQVKDEEGNLNRIVKQHEAGKTTLSVYDEAGKLVHQHQSKYKLSESGDVQIFTYFSMEATAGPAKGQKRADESAYVYRIHGDSFYEFRGALRNDTALPGMIVWRRVKD